VRQGLGSVWPAGTTWLDGGGDWSCSGNYVFYILDVPNRVLFWVVFPVHSVDCTFAIIRAGRSQPGSLARCSGLSGMGWLGWLPGCGWSENFTGMTICLLVEGISGAERSHYKWRILVQSTVAGGEL